MRGRIGLATVVVAALAVAVGSPPAAAAVHDTIPAGAATPIFLPASKVVATCRPPGRFRPTPTKWTVSPSTVTLAGTLAAMPVAGQGLVVTVPAGFPLAQTITISWTGNTDCLSYNGTVQLAVSAAVAKPAPTRDFVRDAVRWAEQLAARVRQASQADRSRRQADTEAQERARLRRENAALEQIRQLGRQAAEALKRFDLTKLPKTPRGPAADLRAGQLKAMPGFVEKLSELAGSNTVMQQKADEYYASSPAVAAEMDLLSRQFDGKSYQQLSPADRLAIAKQVSAQSGGLDVVLQRARDTSKAGTRVIFGGR
jgi:hypothetical protein